MKQHPGMQSATLSADRASGVMVFAACLFVMLVFVTPKATGTDQYRAAEARVQAIATNPKAIGQKEIEFLSAHAYFPQAVEALAQATTPEARAALQAVAIGGNNYAARLYVQGLTNQLEGLKLLDSKSPEVRAIALRGLLGPRGTGHVTLDRGAWDIIKRILDSENLEHRKLATRVTAQSGGSEVSLEEKVKSLAASMATTLTVPEARKQGGAGGFAWDYRCPLGEDVLAEQGASLSRMKGITPELLATLTPAEPGLVREIMIIARFGAGEQALRGDLHGILTNSASARMRMAALDVGLFRVMTEADRKCLERMAAADPLEGKPGFERRHLNDNMIREGKRDAKVYPARAQAEWYLQALDARRNPRPSGP